MNQTELTVLIKMHEKWLNSDGSEGAIADFSQTNLRNKFQDSQNKSFFHFPTPEHSISSQGSGQGMIVSHFKDLDFGSANLTNAVIGDALFEDCSIHNAIWDNCDFNKAILCNIHLNCFCFRFFNNYILLSHS